MMKKQSMIFFAIFALALTNCTETSSTPTAMLPPATPTPAPSATSTTSPTALSTYTPTTTITPAPILLDSSEMITVDTVDDLELLHILKPNTGSIASISFSKNGSLLGVAPWTGKAELWNVSTLEEIYTSIVAKEEARVQLFSRSGNQILAVSNVNDDIEILELITGELAYSFEGSLFSVGPAVSTEGDMIALSSIGWPRGQNVVIWDLASQEKIQTLYGDWATHNPHGYPMPYSVFFSPDDSLLATDLSVDRTIIWDTETWDRVANFENVSAHAFSPDGTILSGREGEHDIVFFNTSTWERIKVITDTSARILSAEFSPDGKLLIACASNGDIIFWDWGAGNKLRTLSAFSFLSPVLSPDGTLLVSHNEIENEIYFWGIP